MTKQNKKSNKLLYWSIGVIVFLIVVIIIGKSNGLIGKPKAVEVDFAKVKKVSITEKVSASGTVQPVTEVKLAPEVSGEVIFLNVEDGDLVQAGDVLVKIRPDVWNSQLERSEAALNQQKANFESSRATLLRAEATALRAEQEYKRQEILWNEKVISESEWQLAQQNYKIAQNDLKSAIQGVEATRYVVNSTNASVRESRANVAKTSVVAPMKGIVSKLFIKKGERVVGAATMMGTEMLRIADLNKMEVRVNVNENDIVRVHLLDSVVIDVDSYASTDKKFKGIVTNIANTAKEKLSPDAITEFEVRILILRSSYEDLIAQGNKFPFRPGMTASVDIITKTKENVLSVPLMAVTQRDQEDEEQSDEDQKQKKSEEREVTNESWKTEKKEEKLVVFVNDNGVAKMTEVKTGISDYNNIEIISGLNENTEIVSGPFLIISKKLKNGDRIVKKEKESEKKDDK